MLYLLCLHDIPDNTAIRARLLDEHMQHIGGHLKKIRLAGPLLGDDAATPAGGLLILEAESEQAVRDIVEADPYFRAGLWDEVRIQPFKEIINSWRQ